MIRRRRIVRPPVATPTAGDRPGAGARRALALAFAIASTFGAAPGAGARAGEPPPKAPTQTAPAAPVRVFTNADLERYKKPAGERTPLREAAPPPPVTRVVPVPPPAAAEALPPQPEATVTEPEAPPPSAEAPPPEDRIEPVETKDLRAREEELERLLQYLQAKAQWLKNPLLPAPVPPAGEMLADPAQGSGQQYQATRTRAARTETRLLRVRAMLKARGED